MKTTWFLIGFASAFLVSFLFAIAFALGWIGTALYHFENWYNKTFILKNKQNENE